MQEEFGKIASMFRGDTLDFEPQNPEDDIAARRHFYRGLEPEKYHRYLDYVYHQHLDHDRSHIEDLSDLDYNPLS